MSRRSSRKKAASAEAEEDNLPAKQQKLSDVAEVVAKDENEPPKAARDEENAADAAPTDVATSAKEDGAAPVTKARPRSCISVSFIVPPDPCSSATPTPLATRCASTSEMSRCLWIRVGNRNVAVLKSFWRGKTKLFSGPALKRVLRESSNSPIPPKSSRWRRNVCELALHFAGIKEV